MNFYLTILGSGAALPIGARRCSGQMVNAGGLKILIDCGEATQDRIRHNHIKLQSISTILISHLHGDHFFGLPGLLSTMHLCGRHESITIVAPRGAKEAIGTFFELTGNHVDYPIEWHEMDFDEGSRRVIESARCTVDAFPIYHSVPTYGYRLTIPRAGGPLSYVYCCDTCYDERLLPFIADAHLLCLECTFSNEFEPLAAQRQHLTAGQAGRLARMANAKHLLLTHISARFRDPQPLLEQARAEFENTLVAADNMRLEIRGNGLLLNDATR